jgi:hypothetical protein
MWDKLGFFKANSRGFNMVIFQQEAVMIYWNQQGWWFNQEQLVNLSTKINAFIKQNDDLYGT